jgi:hypothetical protein
MKDPATCMTSRFGPYSPFFHFPHFSDNEIGALSDWAWGITTTLVGYDAYAWGGPTVLEASCAYTHTTAVNTTIPANSLEAFATYLHSLGDAYSHRECLVKLAQRVPPAPWGTHTNPHLENAIAECDYVPNNPQNDDAHGREYGTGWITDSLRTDEGILAIYAEMTRRSLAREGIFIPLDLDADLPGVTGATTLREAFYSFVHQWPFDYELPSRHGESARNRRDYAMQIAQAVQALTRQTIQRVYLPLTLRNYP